jgi:hypothetical protein
VAQPVRECARQAADGCSGQDGKRGDDGGVHRCSPQRLQEVMTTGPRSTYDVDDRGPSEISRELRCPDR